MTPNSVSGHCNSPYLLSHRLNMLTCFIECLTKMLAKFKRHGVFTCGRAVCGRANALQVFAFILVVMIWLLPWEFSYRNNQMLQLSKESIKLWKKSDSKYFFSDLFVLNFPPTYFEKFQLNRKIKRIVK